MKQTASRILVMGAALLSSAPTTEAAAAPPEGGAPPPAVSAWQPVPASPPPGDAFKPRSNWYGWQILLPAITSDLAGAFALFFTLSRDLNALGPPVFVISALGHGFSGPTVHLAHGHVSKAAASFVLSAVLPAAALGVNFASFNLCDRRGGAERVTETCYLPTIILFFATIPTTFVGGMIVDAVVLANEDDKLRGAAARGRVGGSFSLAPLLVPPLRSNQGMAGVWRKGLGREVPVGLSLVGRF
jgi:hypothetical protein